MKITGISTRIVVRVAIEPGEWLLADDQAAVRVEAAWHGTAGWVPQIWAVGRRKDGTWSKAARPAVPCQAWPIPMPVHQALDSALRLVGETALGLDTAGEWAALNLEEFWVR